MRTAELKIIYTTVADAAEAEALARTLVAENLVACANIMPPMRAIYRWKGTLRDEVEVAVLFKTSAAAAPKAMARICELHSYDIPAVEVWAVEDAPEAFAEWILSECK